MRKRKIINKISTLLLLAPIAHAQTEDKNCSTKTANLFSKVFSNSISGPKSFNFQITQAQINNAKPLINKKVLDETLFILPVNDGESKRALEILEAAGAPNVQRSPQAWGAILDKETMPSIAEIQKKNIKRIAIFEIPGKELEDKLRAAGLEITVIDHHSYKGLDRRQPESSLEQLMRLIGWPANEVDKAIAVNDRSYIPGLKQMGLSEDQIREIRTYDLAAQGRSKAQVENEIQKAQQLIPSLPKKGNIILVENIPNVDNGILKQEIAIQSPDGLSSVFEVEGSKIGFSGNPSVAKKLLEFPFESLGYEKDSFAQYGGGDPNASMFFGFKPTKPPTGEKDILPKYVVDEIKKLLEPSMAAHTAQALEKKMTSSIATPASAIPQVVREAGMLPRGSALATSSGDLEKQGIRQIIHAATGSMTKSGPEFDPTLQGVTDALKHSLELAKQNKHKTVAVPFLGGKIFVDRIGIPASELADKIVETALKERDGIQIRFVTFGDEDTKLFEDALRRRNIQGEDVKVTPGSITDIKVHGASAIINAANMEVKFGGGLSGAIGRASGNADGIDQEAASAIQELYSHK